MAEVGLQGAGIVALVGQGEATGVPQHVRVDLEAELGSLASALHMRAKPAVVNGEPRSVVNTNGEWDPARVAAGAGRAARRRGSGALPGVPLLARRTCRMAW